VVRYLKPNLEAIENTPRVEELASARVLISPGHIVIWGSSDSSIVPRLNQIDSAHTTPKADAQTKKTKLYHQLWITWNPRRSCMILTRKKVMATVPQKEKDWTKRKNDVVMEGNASVLMQGRMVITLLRWNSTAV
jgi:hypothetical protein